MVNKWLHDLHLYWMTNANFKDYISTKFALVEENYIELIEKAKYLEKLKVHYD